MNPQLIKEGLLKVTEHISGLELRLSRIAEIIEAADERAGNPDDAEVMAKAMTGDEMKQIYALAKGLK